MDGGGSGGAEKYEQVMSDALAHLKEGDDRFQVKFEELERKRTQLEQRREKNLERWQREIAELSRLEHDLALRKQWQALLTWPLPVPPPEHKDHKMVHCILVITRAAVTLMTAARLPEEYEEGDSGFIMVCPIVICVVALSWLMLAKYDKEQC